MRRYTLQFVFFILCICLVTNATSTTQNDTVLLTKISMNNSRHSTATDFDELDDPHPQNKTQKCSIFFTEFLLYFYFQPIICFFGFILNVINVAVFQRPQFTGAAYAYMRAMSTADAITLIITMPSGLVRCAGYFFYCQHTTFKRFRAVMLYYNTYVLFPVSNISEAASVWFTVLLSVERYAAMKKLGISFRGHRNPCKCKLTNLSCFPQLSCVGKQAWKFPMYNVLRQILSRGHLSSERHTVEASVTKWNCCSTVNFRHSIIGITVSSLLMNMPLFFVQSVQRKPLTDDSNSFVSHSNQSYFTNLHVPTKLYIRLTRFGQSELYKAFSWFRFTTVQVLPLVFLCIANFCLFHFIQLASHRRKQVLTHTSTVTQLESWSKRHRPSSHKENLRNPTSNGGSSTRWQTAQRKLTVLLVVIVFLFLTGQIPQAFAFVTIFEVFGSNCTQWSCCPAYLIYRAVTHTLCLFTYAVNFFVYLTLNTHYKNQLRLWLCVPCLKNLQTEKIIPSKTMPNFANSRNASFHKLPCMNLHGSAYASTENAKCYSYLRCPVSFLDFPSEPVSAPVAFDAQESLVGILPSNLTQCVCYSSCGEGLSESHAKLTASPERESQYLDNSLISLNRRPSAVTGSLRAYEVTHPLPFQSKCFTEIQYGKLKEPYVASRFIAHYSHDSVLRQMTWNHAKSTCVHPWTMYNADLHLRTGVSGSTQSCFTERTPTRTQCCLAKMDSSMWPTDSSILCCDRSSNMSQSNGLSCTAFGTDITTSSKNRNHLCNESSNSITHVLSPLMYQESDFDVISVDESVEPEQLVVNTAL